MILMECFPLHNLLCSVFMSVTRISVIKGDVLVGRSDT